MSFISNPSSAHPSSLPQQGKRALERQQNEHSDGASPWLWATPIVLLIVVPSWWWARHSDESFAKDPQPLPAASRQILPTTDGPRAMTMVAHQLRAPPSAAWRPNRCLATQCRATRRCGACRRSGQPHRASAAGCAGTRERCDNRRRGGSDDPRLDAAVVESLRQWRFEPATRDGHAVVSSVQVPVEFTAQR